MEQWRLEGVQVGGRVSRMGVVGVWTRVGQGRGEELGEGLNCGSFWWWPRQDEN